MAALIGAAAGGVYRGVLYGARLRAGAGGCAVLGHVRRL